MKLKELLKVINKYDTIEILGQFYNSSNLLCIDEMFCDRNYNCTRYIEKYYQCEVVEVRHYTDRICIVIDKQV